MNERLPGVDQKVTEYATRIQAGEDIESVLQGIGPAFRSAVENSLRAQKELPQDNNAPLVIEKPDEAIQKRIAYDNEKIRALRNNLAVEQTALDLEEISRRKKLFGWSASYELALAAQKQGIDLATLDREEYAEFAIKNYLTINDDQLRVAPWQRMMTSAEKIVAEKKRYKEAIAATETLFESFSLSMLNLAKKNQSERFISSNVRVLSGTKDSNSWLHFAIGNAESANEKEKTFKSYICLKDLSLFTPNLFIEFLKTLEQEGYQGQVKTFQEMYLQGLSLNDQIVMHGNTEADSLKALEIAKKFFGENIASSSVGADENIDGKNKSYSQILSEKIRKEIESK